MMLASLTLLLLACTSPPATSNPPKPSEPPPTDSATGEHETADSSTPQSYVDPLLEGDGWHMEDGRCVVTASVPAAPERHLASEPPPAPVGAATCNDDFDCLEEEFCGAGSCRPRYDGELVTLCVEEIWFEGETRYPPSGQLVATHRYNIYDEYNGRPLHFLVAPRQRGCRMVVRHCEQMPPGPFHVDYRTDITGYGGSDRVCNGNFAAGGLYGGKGLGEPNMSEVIGRGVQSETSGDGTIWYSVWYP